MTRPIVSIVDPNHADAKSAQSAVRAMGLEVAIYHSGPEFLRRFKPSRPGCVILEARVPGFHGIQLLDELVASETPQPVIFLTAYASIAMAVRALRRGALNFLEKPIRQSELGPAVAEALQLCEQRQARRIENARKRSDPIVAGSSTPQTAWDMSFPYAPSTCAAPA